MANMVVTILEAHVAPDKWDVLRQAYEQGRDRLPSQMVQNFLIQNEADPTLWRAMSIWQSRAALDEYRRSVETPGGVLIFRAAGAEPTLAIYEIVAHQRP